MTDYLGQRFGNYRLIQRLGQGGFADVYLGEHVRLGMKAAIKVLQTHLVGDDIRLFQQEAQIIAGLKHPHIIRLLDFDVQEGIPFLVLDYAPHGSLRQKHSQRTRLPLPLIVDYATQVVSALQYAHDQKLIHRDVKPENMLIAEQEEIVLSDFGIATIAHATSSMSTQASMGTLVYMAPEQIQGKARPASDQYALAVTIYHWLAGTFPFQGSSTEVIAQHLGGVVPSFREQGVQVAPEVEQVVLTALAKDPGARFGNVQAFANALAQASGVAASSVQSSSVSFPVQSAPAPTAIAAPQVNTAPADTPPVTIAPTISTTPRQGSVFPPLTPLPGRKPLSTGPKGRGMTTWLIGTLIIALVGGIAAAVIPLIIVNHGNSASGTNNILTCAVGTGYDQSSGLIQGESDTFPSGTIVYLVCHLAPGSDPNEVYGELTGPTSKVSDNLTASAGSTTTDAQGIKTEVDPTHNVYYSVYRVYRLSPITFIWNIYYQYNINNTADNRPEIVVNFQVT